jgi:NitT/TauT family transport system substrate-binding protein
LRLERKQFIAGLTAAAAFRAGPVAAQSSATEAIRIGGGPTDSYIEPFLALDGGFFQRAGLNVEVTSLSNGAAIAAGVAGGALDVGLGDMTQIANAVSRGLPFAFFAGGALYSSTAPLLALCVAKTSQAKSAKDLENQTIGVVVLKSLTEASIREWLRVNGADATKIKLLEIPYSEMSPALDRGTLAAAFIGEPFLSAAKANVRIFARTYDVVAPSFYIGAWFSSRSWLSKNPELARRLTDTLYRSALWANGHHNESAAILAKYTKQDVDAIRQMNRATYSTALDAKLMQPVLDIAAKYGLTERRFPAADLMVKV